MEQSDISRLLKQNKDLVVIVVLLLVSLLVAKKIHDAQIGRYNSLKDKIQAEREKGESLDRIVTVNEKVKQLKQRSWKVTDFNTIVEYVSQLASESSVKVSNIMPQEKRDEAHFIVIPFQVNAEAGFKETLVFLKKLETGPFLLHVRDIILAPDRRDFMEGEAQPKKKLAGSNLSINLSAEAYYFK
jgi:Tfp pilus assembly protein PilO